MSTCRVECCIRLLRASRGVRSPFNRALYLHAEDEHTRGPPTCRLSTTCTISPHLGHVAGMARHSLLPLSCKETTTLHAWFNHTCLSHSCNFTNLIAHHSTCGIARHKSEANVPIHHLCERIKGSILQIAEGCRRYSPCQQLSDDLHIKRSRAMPTAAS